MQKRSRAWKFREKLLEGYTFEAQELARRATKRYASMLIVVGILLGICGMTIVSLITLVAR